VYPPWTLYKSLEYLVDVALLAAFLASIDSTKNYRTFLNWTWTLYGFLLGAVWVSAIIRPQEGFFRAQSMQKNFGLLPIQLSGVFPSVSSNKVGDLGALLAILAVCRLLTIKKSDHLTLSHRAWYFALFLFGFVSLILAQTRSALASFVLAVIVFLFLSKRWKALTLLCLAGSSLLAVARVRETLLTFLQRGQTASQLESLSSRLDWWSFAWHKFMQHPWTGLGAYAAGRFAVMASSVGDKSTSSTHSDYVEILV
jgi:O-antigen ligase